MALGDPPPPGRASPGAHAQFTGVGRSPVLFTSVWRSHGCDFLWAHVFDFNLSLPLFLHPWVLNFTCSLCKFKSGDSVFICIS